MYTCFDESYSGLTDAEETEYMDHPYNATRQDMTGTVSRACFRYLGDALTFVKAAIQLETSHCLWRIRNEESGRLCARFEHKAGKVTRQV